MFKTTYFPGAKKYWHMGKIYDWNSVLVHVMSHALHYGSSIFEGIRAYDTAEGPAIFKLKEHLDRFFISADVANMSVPYSKGEISQVIKMLLRENQLRVAYIRPNLFYSYGNLGLVPKFSRVELSIGCWNWGAYLGKEGIEKGVHTLLLPKRRIHISQLDMRAKIGGIYAQSTIEANFARRNGFDEGIFLNIEGRIAEGPGENVMIVKNNKLKTNDQSESVLQGITRSTILKLAQDVGLEAEVSPITVQELIDADEAFFTGTAAEVTPITFVTDGSDKNQVKSEWKKYAIRTGQPGPITRQMASLYADIVRGKNPNYNDWLTYIHDSTEEVEK
jgi:branched-chain amino acid aminotransferase